MDVTLWQMVNGVKSIVASRNGFADGSPIAGQVLVTFGDGSVAAGPAEKLDFDRALSMLNSADPTPPRRVARPAEAISTYLQWKYGVRIDAGDVEAIMYDFAVYAREVLTGATTSEPG